MLTRRQFFKMASSAVVTTMLPPDETPPTSSSTLPVRPRSESIPVTRICLLADVHIAPTDQNPRQANSLAESKLKATLAHLGSHEFDLLIQLGDLITETHEEQINIRNYTNGLRLFKQLPGPFLSVVGNHDLWGIPKEDISQIHSGLGLNTLRGVKEFPYFQIVWLDLVARRGAVGAVPEESVELLRRVIYPDTPTIIFSHYPLGPQDIRGNPYFQNNPALATVANGEAIWKAIRHLPSIRAVVSGHTHQQSHRLLGRTHLFTLPAFIENPDPGLERRVPGIYSVLQVTPDSLNLSSFQGGICVATNDY